MQRGNPTQPPGSISVNVESLLTRMTLPEKIGQMTQVEKNSLSPQDVTDFYIGSVLSGGGGNPIPNTPADWLAMVRGFQEAALQTRLRIPLIYGADAVHGHSNVHGATIFPHNIGLGATRDPALVETVARITAAEMLATGVHWSFAPTVAVPQDIRWGRTYEGFGQDTALVAEMGAAYVRGLQNHAGAPNLAHPHTALACAKHFVADGGTSWGSTLTYDWIDWAWGSDDDRWSIDQGDAEIDEETLRTVHLPPYRSAITAGARSIMISYSSWNGEKLHAHKYLLTDVLKDEIGFGGFLVSDWLALHQLDRDYYAAIVTAINAGLDMVMVPFDYRSFIAHLTRAVEVGDVSTARVDDAVRRILTVKAELGLFDAPYADESLLAQVGAPAHRDVARQAVRQSLVLLKNDDAALPLSKATPNILVAGPAANDVGLQCGGWTIEWMGGAGDITPGVTLLEALREAVAPTAIIEYDPSGDFHQHSSAPADVGLVILSEAPYAEGEGDRADLRLSAEETAIIERVRPCCRRLIIILYTGRPRIITPLLPIADAIVVAWLPGSEGGAGIADVLLGDAPFTGKLPCPWPRSMAQIPLSALQADAEPPLFPFGHGLT